MTQPVCAYEGCGQPEDKFCHDVYPENKIGLYNHAFQPQSTVESASTSPQGGGDDEPIECTHGISITEHCPDCPSNSWPKRAQGTVPGPQFAGVLETAAKDIVFQLGVMSSEQNVFNYKNVLSILHRHLLTSEPHSPPITLGYVQEVRPDDAEDPSCHVCGAIFTPTGLTQPEQPKYQCLSCGATTGCTPAEEQGNHIVQSPEMVERAAGASVDERLTEIAERESKATEGPWLETPDNYGVSRIWDSDMDCDIACCEGDGSIPREQRVANQSFIAHARADIPYLLGLAAELRQERDKYLEWANCGGVPCGRVCSDPAEPGHEIYGPHYGNGDGTFVCEVHRMRQLTARAEQAERERDEARGLESFQRTHRSSLLSLVNWLQHNGWKDAVDLAATATNSDGAGYKWLTETMGKLGSVSV